MSKIVTVTIPGFVSPLTGCGVRSQVLIAPGRGIFSGIRRTRGNFEYGKTSTTTPNRARLAWVRMTKQHPSHEILRENGGLNLPYTTGTRETTISYGIFLKQILFYMVFYLVLLFSFFLLVFRFLGSWTKKMALIQTWASGGMLERTKLHVTTSCDSFSIAICSALDSVKVTPPRPPSCSSATWRLKRDRSSAVTFSSLKLLCVEKKIQTGQGNVQGRGWSQKSEKLKEKRGEGGRMTKSRKRKKTQKKGEKEKIRLWGGGMDDKGGWRGGGRKGGRRDGGKAYDSIVDTEGTTHYSAVSQRLGRK